MLPTSDGVHDFVEIITWQLMNTMNVDIWYQ